ncbi:helix-turn-helix domain-containing protein, partial [Sinorhizobium fredii]
MRTVSAKSDNSYKAAHLGCVRRKQARRTTVRDIRTILRLTHEEGLSVREIAERLKIGKSSVST